MVPTDSFPTAGKLPDPDVPEFAPIRADLTLLYMKHKGDMAMGDWPDGEIIARVTEITSALIVLGRMARANDDWPWLLRHGWWFDAVGRLFDDQLAAPLDA